jgi:integral membrane protein
MTDRLSALQDERTELRRLRLVSLVEGSTLVLLVLVAVPLKHFAGVTQATRIMGPIHGLAFLAYVWLLIQAVSAGGWSRRETVRLLVAAFIPFGAFANERLIRRRERALAA